MNKGWIKLHRELQDHWLWENTKEFTKAQAWIDILLRANHKTKKLLFDNDLIKCKRGEFITSEVKLADRWGWSRTKVRSFLHLLEEDEMIKKQVKNNRYTRLSVCNYSTYQQSKTTEKQDKNNSETTEKQLKNTNKNDNNVKNENNVKKSVSTNGTDFPQCAEYQQEAKEIATYLLDAIIEYDPTHRYANNKPSINRWVLDIERAMRLDGRTEEQLKFIIDYIFRTNGKHSAFWAGNIESGNKLRKQFDKIKNQIKQETNYGKRTEIQSTIDSLY